MIRLLPLALLAVAACNRPRSTGTPLGGRVDAIYVLDAGGRTVRRPLPEGKRATVIWFWSCTCQCVAECERRIHALLDRYADKNVAFLAIDSNPHDTPERIEAQRAKLGSPYTVLRDANGRTMRMLGIHASASVAVLDKERRLRFRGAIDDDRYDPKVSYVERAVDAILAGEEVEPKTARSYGCLYPQPE